MLPSLISNRIFLSDGGYVGSVGGYVVEENYSEIFKKIGVDFHIYSSEGTSDYKFHNEFLPISKEINDHITQNLTNKMNKYFESLERIRPEVFKNKESLNFMNFKKGFDLSSDEAIELGLVDEIGELSDSLDFMKNLIFKKQGLKEFSIIKINNSSFDKKNKDSFGESQSYLQDLVLRSAIETLIQNKIRSDN
jgi:ClpP class serine protease